MAGFETTLHELIDELGMEILFSPLRIQGVLQDDHPNEPQKIFATMAIGGFLISSVYGSDTWPEKYVRKTNSKIWNLIQKRCSTALCKDHLNKLRTERLQSAGKVSGGCKNIYPPPRTYEERIRLCGNAESRTVLGRSTSSPSQKNYDHVSGGQKSHYNEPALVEKN